MPLAIWDASRRACKFNLAALDLLKFSQDDFQTQPNLWLQQVHEQDLLVWHTQLRRFARGDGLVISDYRFFPKGATDPIWLREFMMPIKTPHPLWKSMSSYTDITELKNAANGGHDQEASPHTQDETLRSLFHDINNKVQRLSMEIELASLESGQQSELSQKISDALAEVTRSIEQIHARVLGTKRNGSI